MAVTVKRFKVTLSGTKNREKNTTILSTALLTEYQMDVGTLTAWFLLTFTYCKKAMILNAAAHICLIWPFFSKVVLKYEMYIIQTKVDLVHFSYCACTKTASPLDFYLFPLNNSTSANSSRTDLDVSKWPYYLQDKPLFAHSTATNSNREETEKKKIQKWVSGLLWWIEFTWKSHHAVQQPSNGTSRH